VIVMVMVTRPGGENSTASDIRLALGDGKPSNGAAVQFLHCKIGCFAGHRGALGPANSTYQRNGLVGAIDYAV
jgi:hypothetical protein